MELATEAAFDAMCSSVVELREEITTLRAGVDTQTLSALTDRMDGIERRIRAIEEREEELRQERVEALKALLCGLRRVDDDDAPPRFQRTPCP